MRIIDLAVRGTATVRIAPELGGAIAAFTSHDRPVLRRMPDQALARRDVRLASCYPLVPWSNRIRDARLLFAGRQHVLERNFGTHPHAIHGVGWQRPWVVEEASAQRVRLAFAHRARPAGAAVWPWPFHATQTFDLVELDRAGGAATAMLSATLTLENAGTEAFPFGLGWHPFFPKHASTTLAFDAPSVWENDSTQLPERRIAVPRPWRFDRPRSLTGTVLDNVFTGWSGSATLVDPVARMRTTLAADSACRYLVVYAPSGADFIALEPVTHETDAFNRHAHGIADTGFRTLPPGGGFSCTMRIVACPLD